MPLSSLTCPICLAVLKPKTPVLEGTRVRCPKCKGAFVAEGSPPRREEAGFAQEPMAEAVDEPAEEEIMDAVEADDEPAPRRRRRIRDDEEEQRPRRAKKGGVPVWVWLAGGGVALFLLCGCCGVGGWVIWSSMGGTGPVTAGNYTQLKKGMTQTEVHNILGQPTISTPPVAGNQAETWQNGSDFITVTFQNGKAILRSCNIQHNGAIQLQDSGILPW